MIDLCCIVLFRSAIVSFEFATYFEELHVPVLLLFNRVRALTMELLTFLFYFFREQRYFLKFREP